MLQFSLLGDQLGVVPRGRTVATEAPITPTTRAGDRPLAPLIPLRGTCTADGRFIWDEGGFWRRLHAGEICATTGEQSIEVRTEGQGGIAITPSVVTQIGPWTIPLPRPGHSYSWLLDSYDKLTPEVATIINKQLQTPIQDGWKTPWQINWWEGKPLDVRPMEPGASFSYAGVEFRWPAQAPWGGPWLTTKGWLTLMGLSDGTIIDNGYLGGLGDPTLCGGRSQTACATMGSTADRISPIAKFKHPQTGEDWGLWIQFAPVGPEIHPVRVADGVEATSLSTRSIGLRLKVQKIPQDPWYQSILKVLFYLPAKLFEVVVSTVSEIVGLACNDPAKAQVAASSVGPAAIAAVGAALLLCSPGPGTSPSEEKVDENTGKKKPPWGLIIAGGIAFVGVLAFLLTPPKT